MEIAFVCPDNAGRSQMAAAFARAERAERGLEGEVSVISGATEPADRIHDTVVRAMTELDIDLTDQAPQQFPSEELTETAIVVTAGCSATEVCPMTWRGVRYDWALEDPAGTPMATVREIRDEIRSRVQRLFEAIEARA